MADTTTLTVRTKKQIKKQAQEFFDGMGITLSAAINMFLSDVAHNQRVSFQIENIILTPAPVDTLPLDAQASYYEMKQMNNDDFVYFSASGDENR